MNRRRSEPATLDLREPQQLGRFVAGHRVFLFCHIRLLFARGYLDEIPENNRADNELNRPISAHSHGVLSLRSSLRILVSPVGESVEASV
jgi:hypothetical protein